eukprot:tig00001343_g8335.t1
MDAEAAIAKFKARILKKKASESESDRTRAPQRQTPLEPPSVPSASASSAPLLNDDALLRAAFGHERSGTNSSASGPSKGREVHQEAMSRFRRPAREDSLLADVLDHRGGLAAGLAATVGPAKRGLADPLLDSSGIFKKGKRSMGAKEAVESLSRAAFSELDFFLCGRGPGPGPASTPPPPGAPRAASPEQQPHPGGPVSSQAPAAKSAPEGAGPASSNTGVRGSGPAPAPGREAGGGGAGVETLSPEWVPATRLAQQAADSVCLRQLLRDGPDPRLPAPPGPPPPPRSDAYELEAGARGSGGGGGGPAGGVCGGAPGGEMVAQAARGAEGAEEALEEGFEEEEAGRGEEPFERDWGGAGAEGAEGPALPPPPARPGPARSFSAHAGASWRPAPGRGPRGAGGGPEWPPLESPRRGHSAPKLSPQRFLRSS